VGGGAGSLCGPITANAKLSDAQINSVGSPLPFLTAGTPKIFKLVSPGEDGEPRGTYYMRTAGHMNEYVDTEPAMNLLPVEWSDHGWNSDEWASGCDRIDSECLYGNTCNRIFTDYSGTAGCYPSQGKRCFNDGAPCGHQLIKNFEMWVRPVIPFRQGKQQCFTVESERVEADTNHRNDNPIFGGGGFSGVWTLERCAAECMSMHNKDPHGRRCVAFEW
jgi:hypothetical protein